MSFEFFDPPERDWIQTFQNQGYLIFDLEQDLDCIDQTLCEASARYLGQSISPEELYQNTPQWVPIDQLNGFRVALIQALRQPKTIGRALYGCAKHPIHALIGNELAMQRGPNLSIQYPNDPSSLLAIHSDVWSGNSPYELVLWVPLVDCYATKSMYLLPLPDSQSVYQNFSHYQNLSAEAFYAAVADSAQFLTIKRGQGLLFWHGLVHGNRINQEAKTRWSMNIRFKSFLSPYGSKELGETFLPITIRPATRLGYAYRRPT
ncbi:MAG: hypothetical protein H6510_00940 [Acidobacteria bacterium]|nr:hypothetical protein [Acidobacteriota bacterium]